MHIPGVFVVPIVSQSCPLALLWDRLGWRVQLLPTKLRWRETVGGDSHSQTIHQHGDILGRKHETERVERCDP